MTILPVPRPSWQQRWTARCSPVCGALAAGGALALWHGLLAVASRTVGATALLHGVDLFGGSLAAAACALLAETLAYEAIRPRLTTRAPHSASSEKTAPQEFPEPLWSEAIVPPHSALSAYPKDKALWNNH